MIQSSPADRRARFRQMHDSGCFLLPNPWDIGSTKRLEAAGFGAVATSSAAAACALGKQDYQITLADALVHCALIAGATDLPVNADFENGFSNEPEEVAENVERAVATGIAGLSIEDRAQGNDLRNLDNAVACVRAARQACGDAVRNLPRRRQGSGLRYRAAAGLCRSRCRLPLRARPGRSGRRRADR